MNSYCRKFLLIVASTLLFSSYVSYQDKHYVDYFLRNYTAQLFRDKLYVVNSLNVYWNADKVERIKISFSVFQGLHKDAARDLVLGEARDLIERINNDPLMKKKRLLGDHFCIRKLDLELKFDNIIAGCFNSIIIRNVHFDGDTITYETYSETPYYSYGRQVIQESYHDALFLVKGAPTDGTSERIAQWKKEWVEKKKASAAKAVALLRAQPKELLIQQENLLTLEGKKVEVKATPVEETNRLESGKTPLPATPAEIVKKPPEEVKEAPFQQAPQEQPEQLPKQPPQVEEKPIVPAGGQTGLLPQFEENLPQPGPIDEKNMLSVPPVGQTGMTPELEEKTLMPAEGQTGLQLKVEEKAPVPEQKIEQPVTPAIPEQQTEQPTTPAVPEPKIDLPVTPAVGQTGLEPPLEEKAPQLIPVEELVKPTEPPVGPTGMQQQVEEKIPAPVEQENKPLVPSVGQTGMQPPEKEESKTELGFFARMSRLFFGPQQETAAVEKSADGTEVVAQQTEEVKQPQESAPSIPQSGSSDLTSTIGPTGQDEAQEAKEVPQGVPQEPTPPIPQNVSSDLNKAIGEIEAKETESSGTTGQDVQVAQEAQPQEPTPPIPQNVSSDLNKAIGEIEAQKTESSGPTGQDVQVAEVETPASSGSLDLNAVAGPTGQDEAQVAKEVPQEPTPPIPQNVSSDLNKAIGEIEAQKTESSGPTGQDVQVAQEAQPQEPTPPIPQNVSSDLNKAIGEIEAQKTESSGPTGQDVQVAEAGTPTSSGSTDPNVTAGPTGQDSQVAQEAQPLAPTPSILQEDQNSRAEGATGQIAAIQEKVAELVQPQPEASVQPEQKNFIDQLVNSVREPKQEPQKEVPCEEKAQQSEQPQQETVTKQDEKNFIDQLVNSVREPKQEPQKETESQKEAPKSEPQQNFINQLVQSVREKESDEAEEEQSLQQAEPEDDSEETSQANETVAQELNLDGEKEASPQGKFEPSCKDCFSFDKEQKEILSKLIHEGELQEKDVAVLFEDKKEGEPDYLGDSSTSDDEPSDDDDDDDDSDDEGTPSPQ